MGLVGENMDIKFHMLKDITNKFGIDQFIGCGGYGIVYKGLYNGQEIAVKRLRQLQGLDDTAFDNEFRNLCKIRHPNIVGLIGYCHESTRKFIPHDGKIITAYEMERVLCFEYVDGGNLEDHISDESCRLNWPTCLKIIKDTCEGLHHLHNAQEKHIYHLDLKPANILLDKKTITAKIGDLGLSRLVTSTKTHQTEKVKGTPGYMPPEYIQHGHVTKKFDVFSFGVMIIKLMDGNNGLYRRTKMSPEQFIELVTTNWKGKLQGTSGYLSRREIYISQVKTCIDIALRCVHEDRDERPEIKDIINELEELEQPSVDEMSLYSAAGTTQVSKSSFNLMDALDATVTAPILQKLRALALAVNNLENKFVQVNLASVQISNLTTNMDAMAGQLDNLTKKVDSMAEKLNKW